MSRIIPITSPAMTYRYSYPKPTNQEKVDAAADILLEKGCTIFGSYIHKRMLQGSPVNDVDVVPETQSLYREVMRSHMTRKESIFSESEHKILDSVKIDILHPDALSALFHTYRAVGWYIASRSSPVVSRSSPQSTTPAPPSSLDTFTREVNFISTVGLKKKGRQMEFVPLTEHVSQRQVDFVIDSLSEGRYCPWAGMRQKDIEFFRGFNIIPKAECSAFGF